MAKFQNFKISKITNSIEDVIKPLEFNTQAIIVQFSCLNLIKSTYINI